MPWNLVSCWSSSASEPVSTRVSPSAIVPRRKRLFALIASLGERRTLISRHRADTFPRAAAHPAPPRRPCRLLAKDALQRGVHVLRHRVGVAADVDRRAILHPRVQLAPRVPQRMLHVALLRLVARERHVQPRQHAALQQVLPFELIQEVVRVVAVAEHQPVASARADRIALLHEARGTAPRRCPVRS